MKEFNELTSTLETYMSVEHLEIVRRACEFATVAHEHQTRSTGEVENDGGARWLLVFYKQRDFRLREVNSSLPYTRNA